MSTKQNTKAIWRNIDFTDMSAYKTIEEWEKVTRISCQWFKPVYNLNFFIKCRA
jgi:hypothetical protein